MQPIRGGLGRVGTAGLPSEKFGKNSDWTVGENLGTNGGEEFGPQKIPEVFGKNQTRL